MIQLDLDREETALLAEALTSYLSDLRMEIADTDRQEFREGLKRKKQVLLKTLEALGHSVT